jgi:hypothetical protein
MKGRGFVVVAMVGLGLSGPASAQVVDNSTLQCGTGAPTYYPRGDRWVTTIDGSLETISVKYLIQSDGTADVSNGSEFGAIEEAAVAWGTTTCGGVGIFPSVWMELDPTTYTARNNGDGSGVYKNIVYWAETDPDWEADSATIALTTNVRTLDTGFIVTSDMEFNGFNYSFRVGAGGGANGCAAGSVGCYEVKAVALHEFGHFLGFNHVQCTDAVMFPNGSATGGLTALSIHERTGLCKVYPPRPASEPKAALGELCDALADCAAGYFCLISPGGTVGWCAESCTTTASCDDGYVCRTSDAGEKFCGPGVHNSGDSGTDPGTGLPPDLCAPCGEGDDCADGVCVLDPSTDTRLCTVPCEPDGGCPAGMECLPTGDGGNVCWPTSDGSCGGADQRRDLGEICYDENVGGDPQIYECGPGLVCFVFKPRPEGQVGACLPYCNTFDSPCPLTGQTCCFGADDFGSCLPYAASRPHGACFDIRSEGQTCSLAEESICEDGTTCINFNNTIKCFKPCDGNPGLCAADQECVPWDFAAGGSIELCCDAEDLAEDPNNCIPSAVSVYNVGVACDVNADCDSSLCLKHDGEAACSRSCDPYTGFGCPGNIDANGDDEPDGGYHCLLLEGGEGRCWPNEGPIAPPAVPVVPPPPASGCACNGGAADLPFIGLAALAAWCRRRRVV